MFYLLYIVWIELCISKELEELKKENKNMKKDMKKLLKKLEKEEEKSKAANMGKIFSSAQLYGSVRFRDHDTYGRNCVTIFKKHFY